MNALDDTRPIPLLGDTQPIHPVRPRRWRLLLLIALPIVFALVVAVAGLVLSLPPPAVAVTLVIDGAAQSLLTDASTVGALLAARSVTLAPGDRLSPPANTAITPSQMTIRLERARPVSLMVDSRARIVHTTGQTPHALLAEADIALETGAALLIDGVQVDEVAFSRWRAPFQRIEIVHARAFTLTEQVGTQTSTRLLSAAALSVGEALFAAGVPLALSDQLSPAADTPLEPDMTITLRRAFEVTVEADGARITALVAGGTVADALAEADVTLVGLDSVVPGESSPLRPGEVVRVFRVREEMVRELTAIPYETVYQADAEAELDTRTTLQTGRDGVSQTLTRVRYENDIAIARETEAATVVRPPQDAILGYGTRVVVRTIETPEGTREYWRSFQLYATSYHPAALGGDDVTATGRRLQRGIIGADPDLLRYGTEIYVEGYGTGIIADTGGPRNTTRWLDLGYSDSDFINWHRTVTAYLLTPIPDTIDYTPPR